MSKRPLINNDALISVLIPMYNVEKTIARCIKSVLKQTYTNIEIVLLDDGSKDNTYAIAKKFADEDKRIKLLTKQNEGNISKTRNYLLDNYSGDYVVWVDSDDVIHKRYVEKLYTALVEANADCAVCKFKMRPYNAPLFKKLFPRKRIYEKDDIIPNMLLGTKIRFMLWNKIYKKELLQGIRFDDTVRYGEDLVFCMQYMRRCQKIVVINEKLYKYIVRAGSEMQQKFTYKHVTFIDYLESTSEREEDPIIKSALRAWLSFSCNTLLFVAKMSKYKEVEVLDRMRELASRYKDEFFNNKCTQCGYKMIAGLGFKTWARKKKNKSTKN